MSIKWKITISLILLSLCLVSVYIFTATHIFESDKVSYIFEEQQNKIELQVQKFNQAIDSSIWFARLLFKDQNMKEKNSEQETLLQNQNFIDGIFIFDYSNKNIETYFTKKAEFKLNADLFFDKINYKKNQVVFYEGNYFLATIPLRHEASKVLLLLIPWQAEDISAQNMQSFFFENDHVIKQSGVKYLENAQGSTILKNLLAGMGDATSTTRKMSFGNSKYLASFAKSNYEGLNFVSITNEKDALMALNELYNKSIIFLIISALVTFIVSLLLSNSLTYRINELTKLASEIGKGNFDIPFDEKSTDEVGILSQAFGKMGSEIKKLFAEKIEKDRMERELKTAGIIQDKLFPIEKNKQINDYNISGHYLTSTECGGDWWHYYQSGEYVYAIIADATGHGTPAALVTSASNAVFSYLGGKEASLEELVDVWDNVVYQTSRGEVLMTAQICRVNLKTGKGEIISLGHEPPVLFDAEKKVGTYVNLPPNYSLGEKKNSQKKIHTFQMKKGDHLLLYTDGIQASMFKEKQEMSEKQILRVYNNFFQNLSSSDHLTNNLYQFLRDKSDPIHQLEDDITLVSISYL